MTQPLLLVCAIPNGVLQDLADFCSLPPKDHSFYMQELAINIAFLSSHYTILKTIKQSGDTVFFKGFLKSQRFDRFATFL